MQGTTQISYESCGRRFYLRDFTGIYDTVSGRSQNWLDTDGTAAGLGEPVLIFSGLDSAKNWIEVDDDGKKPCDHDGAF